MRIALAGFLLTDGEVEYITEEQHADQTGPLVLISSVLRGA